MGQAASYLELDDVTIRFGERTILDRLNWRLVEGESAVILGPSGSGKSVFLSILLGFLKPDSGSVRYDGIDATDRFSRISVLFQEDALLDDRTVEANLALARLERLDVFRGPFDEATERAIDATLRDVGLDPERVRRQHPAQLSGGMRRRVALARTIIREPKVLIADEPTTGLDPATAKTIYELMRKIVRERGMTTVVVSHDPLCAAILGEPVYYFTPLRGELTRFPNGAGERPNAAGANALERREAIEGWVRRVREQPASAERIEADAGAESGAIAPASPDYFQRRFLTGIDALGRGVLRAVRALRMPRPGLLLHDLRLWGWHSAGLVLLIFLMMGVVLQVQTDVAVSDVGFSNRLPELFALGLTRITPIVTAILMAGRSGSAVTAQAGWRVLSGQQRMLETMRIDPDRELLSSVFWAWLLALPVLAVMGMIAAVGAAWSVLALPIGRSQITARFFLNDLPQHLEALDLTVGLFKLLLMGGGAVLIAYLSGSAPKRSAAEISGAMTQSLVVAFIWIALVDMTVSLATGM